MATHSEIKDMAIRSRDRDIEFLKQQLAQARKDAFLDSYRVLLGIWRNQQLSTNSVARMMIEAAEAMSRAAEKP